MSRVRRTANPKAAEPETQSAGSDRDTIVAVSSSDGVSGRAIVRLSGPDSLSAVQRVFGSPDTDPPTLPTRRVVTGTLTLQTFPAGIPARLYLMRAPHSYTREDVVELHVPGSPPLVQELVRVLLSAGVRAARPGEFTERAYLSGRIDLSQAEAVMKIVTASNAQEVRLGLGELAGGLSRDIQRSRKRLFDLLVELEATLDFSEEEIDFVTAEEVQGILDGVRETLMRTERQGEEGYVFRERPRVMLLGRTNVGKSSLYNRLLGFSEAIVSRQPGTTRDVLECDVMLDGEAVTLVDAAGREERVEGLRATAADRARTESERADVTLVVLDGSVGVCEEDRTLMRSVADRPGLVVINKSDLDWAVTTEAVGVESGGRETLRVSALSGEGCTDLASWVGRAIREGRLGRSQAGYILNVRQREAVRRATEATGRALQAVGAGLGYEFVALEVRSATDALSELTRPVGHDEILDAIFAQFCVGK